VTTQGKTLEYHAMCIDYTTKGKVKISMHEYINKILAELPSDMNGVSTTPAAIHLFNVDYGAEKLESTAVSPPGCKIAIFKPEK